MVGPAGSHLAPVGNFALGGGLPHFFELGHGNIIGPGVLGIDHHGEGVKGHWQFEVAHVVGIASGNLCCRDRARSIADVSLPSAKFLEASTSTRKAHGYLNWVAGLGVVGFCDRLSNRKDCARAVNQHGAALLNGVVWLRRSALEGPTGS